MDSRTTNSARTDAAAPSSATAAPPPPPPAFRSADAVESTGGWGDASVGKVGLWVFLATDVMAFAGLLLAYALLRVRAPAWPDPALRFDRALAGALTFILLFSGASMSAALVAARQGRLRAGRALLATTAVAGAIFLAGQTWEFRSLVRERHIGLTTDHAAALFYVIASYHGLHVLVGVVILALLFGRSRVGAKAGVTLPVGWEVAALYWQFVDVVWVVIFTLLYLLPPVNGRA